MSKAMEEFRKLYKKDGEEAKAKEVAIKGWRRSKSKRGSNQVLT